MSAKYRAPICIGLAVEDAASAVGVGQTKFREMVAAGTMPKPRLAGSKRLWDVDELVAAFKNLPSDGAEELPDTWADFRNS